LIDFKKELTRFKPARTLEELNAGVANGDISDVNDFLRYIINEQIDKPNRTAGQPKKSRGSQSKERDFN